MAFLTCNFSVIYSNEFINDFPQSIELPYGQHFDIFDSIRKLNRKSTFLPCRCRTWRSGRRARWWRCPSGRRCSLYRICKRNTMCEAWGEEKNHCIELRSFRGLQFSCWTKKRQRGCQSFSCYLLWECTIFIPMCTSIFLNIRSRPISIWEHIPAITKHLENANQKPNGISTHTILRFLFFYIVKSSSLYYRYRIGIGERAHQRRVFTFLARCPGFSSQHPY